MSISLQCPNPTCRKVSVASEEIQGRNVRCKHCGQSFLATSTTEAGAVDTRPAPRSSRSGELPTGIGRFQIRKWLGEGAFGIVYRAYDPRLEREVALKVPNSGVLKNPRRVKRFLREARAAANLRHPHIVPVFDAGQDGDLYYIASAFIAGKELKDAIDDNGLEFSRAARLTRELSEALAYAHTQGIVHRDVKPGNIMLDENDHVHLMDFGLASRQDDESDLSTDGSVMGTPSYMAPEQAMGRKGEAQPSADQYSAGIVLYELLCGKVPWVGPPATVIHNQIHTEPDRPASIRKYIPKDLETICLKAIAKRPEERYANCQAMADDLRRWHDGEPIRARTMGPIERAARWMKRNPAISGLMAAVVLLLVTGSTGIYVKYLEAKLQEEKAVAQELEANMQGAEAVKQAEIAKRNEEAAKSQGEEAIKQGAEAAKQAGIAKENEVKALGQEVEAKKQQAEAVKQTAIAKESLEKTNLALGEKNTALKDMNYSLALAKILLAQAALESQNKLLALERLEEVPPELRRWEWHYLSQNFAKGLFALVGHVDAVTGVAFSPDGTRLVTWSRDKTAKVWDAKSGTRLLDLKEYSGTGMGLRFSPDGTRILTLYGDTAVKVWDAKSGALLDLEFTRL